MSESIKELQSLLNHNIKIAGSGKKYSCFTNEKSMKNNNGIMLFYTGGNDFVSSNNRAYYNQEVQVACRHTNYDNARELAFNSLAKINEDRKVANQTFVNPVNVPSYRGQDARCQYYWWAFDVTLKGKQ